MREIIAGVAVRLLRTPRRPSAHIVVTQIDVDDGLAAMDLSWPFRRPRAAHYRLPPGMRVYAIGDVHGRADLLEPMLGWIRSDSESRSREPQVHVVFLGDLIDRGPDSARIVELLASDPQPFGRRHFLRGNHEQALLDAIDGDLAALDEWLGYGGDATLESYGVDPALQWRDPAALRAEMIAAIPRHHVAFLRSMRPALRLGGYLFVHAGIRPGVPIDSQDEHDLRWIRSDFLDSRADHGVMVVHGHTVSESVVFRRNRIGIDTGAYASGRLSVLGLERERRWLLVSRCPAS